MKTAIISGTSGLVGMQVLHQILKNPEYDYVISVGRRKLALKHQKLVQISGDILEISNWNWADMMVEEDIKGDFQNLKVSIESGETEIHAFCSLGTTIKAAGSQEKFRVIDHDMVLALATWAKSIGTKKFLYVSALGADANSSVFYNKVKGEVEDDLKALDFDFLGLFRPSLLLGNRNEFRFGEQVASILMKPLVWLKLLKNIRPVYDYQVAKAMVVTALQDSSSKVEIIPSGLIQDISK
ncbi:oxidoreductase [Algoriphagus sediminis]|uniref:Oxidoreductase n=1 Tax=Algoriphagus sediminis TaxID=3057113 RepID=A0ABT7Y816_9BACT|nr:oxidoreductase [Algoriphagus sediminis]MDN3202656.1 oxidoreductase [Algoriphagus sediminis]